MRCVNVFSHEFFAWWQWYGNLPCSVLTWNLKNQTQLFWCGPLLVACFNWRWCRTSDWLLEKTQCLDFCLLCPLCSWLPWFLYIGHCLYFVKALKIHDDNMNSLLTLKWGGSSYCFWIGDKQNLGKNMHKIVRLFHLTGMCTVVIWVTNGSDNDWTLRIELR